MAAIPRRIMELREKLTKSAEPTGADLRKQLDELERKKKDARESSDELKGATDPEWHQVRDGMDSALKDLTYSSGNCCPTYRDWWVLRDETGEYQ